MAQNRSSAVMQQRAEPHDSLDYFPTPPWATRALCAFLADRDDLHLLDVWEPCCGEGHMVRPLSEYFNSVYATDVHDYSATYAAQDAQMDFAIDWMIDDANETDWVITNPPFRLATEIIRNALRVASKGVAVLVRTSFLESAGRYDALFGAMPPTFVLPFVERVPMFKGVLRQSGSKYFDAAAGKEKSASTATSYIWLVWLRGNNHPPEMYWLPPCRTQLERPHDYADVPVLEAVVGDLI